MKTGNLKFFSLGLILSLFFWGGVNIFQKGFEDFLFWRKITLNPELMAAQLVAEENSKESKLMRNWQIKDLKLEAKSILSVFVDSKGSSAILFKKESEQKLPIASLAKLMTADVVLDNYDLSQVIEISKHAVDEPEDFGNLKVGESFSARALLYPLLIESSNDAAAALAETIGREAFLDLMNLQAKKLELTNTSFSNMTGLDPENQKDAPNSSTAEDLAKFAEYLFLKHPLIWQILSQKEFDFYSQDNVFHHRLKNTNELLGQNSLILAGKTGETPKSLGCLIILMKAPGNRQGYVFNIILGAEARFEEMKKLIDWLKLAYQW